MDGIDKKPRFTHDCEGCVYLGTFDRHVRGEFRRWDLYWCSSKHENLSSLIATETRVTSTALRIRPRRFVLITSRPRLSARLLVVPSCEVFMRRGRSERSWRAPFVSLSLILSVMIRRLRATCFCQQE